MIFVQPDGKTIVGGYYSLSEGPSRTILSRLNSNGSIDPSFELPASQGGEPWSGALLPDGKVLMSFYFGFPVSPILRFNVDGSLDRTDLAPAGSRIQAVQPDGKVIVANLDGGLVRLFDSGAGVQEFTFSNDGDFDSSGGPVPITVVAATGRAITLAVNRLGETTEKATVDFTTRDGTALAGIDYVARSGTLVFGPLETVKQIVISAIGNPDLKKEKAFSLVLANASQGSILGVHSETALAVAPQQFLTLSYPNSGTGAVIRLTLAPAVPGVAYELQSSPGPTFSWNPLQTSQTKVASDVGSLDFEDTNTLGQTQRFYRAVRLGPAD